MTDIPGDAMFYAMGDWNARIGERSECFIGTRENESNYMFNDFENFDTGDIDNIILEDDFVRNNFNVFRTNKDNKINDYGLRLLNLCHASNLCILNGRAFEDKARGEFTYCNKQGKSVIDFLLCNKIAMYNVCNFDVKPFNCFSDHSILSFDLKVNNYDRFNEEGINREGVLSSKWREDKKDEYVANLESDRITKNIEDITVKLVQTSQKEEVEAILEQFTGILTDAGSDHIREVNINKGGKGNIILGAKWYDKECREQRGRFIEYEKRYYQTFEDGDRVLMCEQRNIFRSLCREKKREYNQKEADRLVYLSKKDPKNFWREFKGNKDRVVDQECNFFEHFKQLANIDSRVGEEGTKEVENENRGDNNNKSETLDSQIKLEELESALKGLKKNKSAGEDNLLNEFFKNASLPVKLFILLLFNKILDMEFFSGNLGHW